MKVAVSTDGTRVSEHFGRCPSFTIAVVEGGRVLEEEVIDNPGHHPGFLPEFLRKRGVDWIVAGGMGARARELFGQHDIETVLGIGGEVSVVLAQLAAGTLAGCDNLCQPRAGKGYGVDKSVCDHGEEGHSHGA